MKKIIVLMALVFVSYSSLQACEGDCVLCHPKLVDAQGKMDKDHEILITCKTCHTQEEMEKIDMGSGCGQDCWDCHDIKKVTASKVKEHNGLQTCIDCHLTLDKNMFGGAESPSAFSEMPTLDDLMAQESANISDDVIIEATAEVTEELNKSEAKIQIDKTEKKEFSAWESIVTFFKTLWQDILNFFS